MNKQVAQSRNNKEADILIISYYAKNKGTTDYFVDFLCAEKIPFFYLRHPLPESNYKDSELLYYDGTGDGQVIKKYESSQNFISKTTRELFLNFSISMRLKLRHKTKRVISFGAVNTVMPLLLNGFGMKTIFWGVDYSDRRFASTYLNKIYLTFETLACHYSAYVIQPTDSQRLARISKHGLKPTKGVIAPNGVTPITDLPKTEKQNNKPALIYIGSLSRQHGISEFINDIYIKHDIKTRLFVFGDGSDKAVIEDMVQRNNLAQVITMFGSKPPSEIEEFIRGSEYRLIGIAPYVEVSGGHIKYGDSLKIKEYVNQGLSFISSSVVSVDQPLKKFGIIYNRPQELSPIIKSDLSRLSIDRNSKNDVMQNYYWNHIFQEKVMNILSETYKRRFKFSILAALRFYSSYVFSKTILIWFDTKESRSKMALVEGTYMLSKLFKLFDKRAYKVPLRVVRSKYGTFEIRPGTADIICVSPEFERSDMRRLLEIISGELKRQKRVLFIDVGADLGTYCITVANAFSNEDGLDIVAFEPAPTSYDLLVRNLNRNAITKNVDARQELLAARPNELIDFFYDHSAPGTSGIIGDNVDPSLHPTQITSTTLDRAIGNRIKDYDVVIMKADIEGAETEVLNGAKSLLTAPKTYFLVEDFVDPRIITALTERANFLDKLTPYNSWWVHEQGA